MSRRPHLAFVLFVLIASIHLDAYAAAPAAPAPDSTATGADLAYRFTLEPSPALAVRVELRAAGSPRGQTDFVVSRSWGGVDTGGDDLFDVEVRDAQGQQLAVDHPEPQLWSVHHAARETLTVSWRLEPNEYQKEQSPDINRRPILNAGLFHTYGELGLLWPHHLDDRQRLRVALAWDGFDAAGWKVACSFGVGPEPRVVDASLAELHESIFMAGDFELLQRDIHGHPLYVALQGKDWDFAPADFADLAAQIVDMERGFFADYDYPFYLITVIAVGEKSPGSTSFGGTGLTNSFALEMLPGVTLHSDFARNKGIAGLLAHEMFHNWNGRIIQRVDPEELVYWFSEGFTDFYTRRLLFRSGLIDVDAYAGSVNRVVADLFASPALHAPNERIRDAFWRDRAVKDLPYWRGDVVAMLLDRAMRRVSRGRRSVDDFMRDLVVAARDCGERVSTDNLLERIERETDARTAARIRRIVLQGEVPKLDETTFEPCLEMRYEQVAGYDLGFDFDTSRKEHVVRGVDSHKAAARAGLRDGMPLVGWSVSAGDPTRKVSFKVKDGDATREIEYRPAGESQLLPRYHPRANAPASDCSGL